MDKKKPVNLQLTTIRFPITAIVSILHRASGVLLFLLIPVLLCMLDSSLASEASFTHLAECFNYPIAKISLWILLAAFAYHIVAGFRHLFMDMGIGESREGGIRSAYLILVISAVLIILAGIWVW